MSLSEFREQLLKSPEMQDRLKDVADTDAFIKLVVEMSQDCKCGVTEQEVRDYISDKAQNLSTVETSINLFKEVKKSPGDSIVPLFW